VLSEIKDKVSWRSVWRIAKFKDAYGTIASMLQHGANVEDVARQFPEAFLGEDRFEGNIALNEGLQLLINLIAGTGTGTPWNAANAYLGVGDGTTAESADQTGLQGTNKQYKAMDSGYPTRTNQTCEWRATFAGTDANFAWNEFTVANGNSDAAVNLNRKVVSKGTKSSGETWTLSLQITFS
jgi:hypothetical protein